MYTQQPGSKRESITYQKGWQIGLSGPKGPEQILLPAKVIKLDLDQPLKDLHIGAPYRSVYALISKGSAPIGHLSIPLLGEWLPASFLKERLLGELKENLTKGLIAEECSIAATDYFGDLPFISIVVCSRDRTEELRHCLRSLEAIDYASCEVIVVDNAPSDDSTERLLRREFPKMRYCCESKPGLDWARNRGVEAARGEIVAFTDDDVQVDPSWLQALARAFRRPEVSAVTGLVFPAELDTPAQALFELAGGFNRGYQRQFIHAGPGNPRRITHHLGAGEYGTGANMAFRRELFDQIMGFDPALDVGTPAEGAGDLEFFFRVVEEGFLLVYDPTVLVWHRHRRDTESLYKQLATWSKGLHVFLEQAGRRYPHLAHGVKKTMRWWEKRNRQLLRDSRRMPTDIPSGVFRSFLNNTDEGQRVYRRSAEQTEAIIRDFGVGEGLSFMTWQALKQEGRISQAKKPPAEQAANQLLELDLSHPIPDWEAGRHCASVNLLIREARQVIGQVNFPNDGFALSGERLKELAVRAIYDYLNEDAQNRWRGNSKAGLDAILEKEIRVAPSHLTGLPERRASIVIATLDRPDALRACLDSILRHRTHVSYEIIVVDNHPASGQSVFARDYHPLVRYLEECKKGLSYARNTGFRAAKGEIVVATDDDVEVSDGWLDQLMKHFSRSDVMGVTGNVLPYRLENRAQQLFESYGGLGRGFVRREYGPRWLQQQRYRPPATWQIGATANAAFRRTALDDPRIGYLPEYLGAGTPAGCSEDTYLFYRILRAGYTIVYEPGAYLYHKHRDTLKAFRKQVYNYSKGHVAYLLVTIFRDNDYRGWYRLLAVLPAWHLRRLWRRGIGKYSRRYVLWEILGNLAGPLGLWRAYRKARSHK